MLSIEMLDKCLQSAQLGVAEIGDKGDHPQLAWLERQLAHVIAQMHGMLLDLQSGMSSKDLGFFGDDDLEEMVTEMDILVASLRRQIRAMLEVSR